MKIRIEKDIVTFTPEHAAETAELEALWIKMGNCLGATNGKFELASCAKKNGLDAIHDTVHEMARDEARHGKALQGLLERYFG